MCTHRSRSRPLAPPDRERFLARARRNRTQKGRSRLVRRDRVFRLDRLEPRPRLRVLVRGLQLLPRGRSRRPLGGLAAAAVAGTVGVRAPAMTCAAAAPFARRGALILAPARRRGRDGSARKQHDCAADPDQDGFGPRHRKRQYRREARGRARRYGTSRGRFHRGSVFTALGLLPDRLPDRPPESQRVLRPELFDLLSGVSAAQQFVRDAERFAGAAPSLDAAAASKSERMPTWSMPATFKAWSAVQRLLARSLGCPVEDDQALVELEKARGPLRARRTRTAGDSGRRRGVSPRSHAPGIALRKSHAKVPPRDRRR